MGREHTIQTTLERLDKKPALWKGLTIDELLIVTCTAIAICCSTSAVIFSVLISEGLIGFVIGMIVSLSLIHI